MGLGFHVGGEMTRSAASKASTKEGRSRDPPASEYLVRVRVRIRVRVRVRVRLTAESSSRGDS